MDTPSVLLVTDNADEKELYELGLSTRGYDVRSMQGLAGIAEAVRESAPSVLVLVLELSHEAWEALDLLKDLAEASGIPWILVTGSVRADGSNRLRARVNGCAAFVAKPCLPDELSAVLRVVLAGERGLIVMRPGDFTARMTGPVDGRGNGQ